MADDLVVVADPWWDLRGGGELEQRQRDALRAELQRELKETHPLFGTHVEVIATCQHCDDVLITSEAHWAIVHLTWAADETPPWPDTTFFDRAQEVEDAAATHAE
jgi:hypothetical protein